MSVKGLIPSGSGFAKTAVSVVIVLAIVKMLPVTLPGVKYIK